MAPVAAIALALEARTGGLRAVRASIGLSTIGVAIGSFLSYALVLGALEIASAPSVAAVRESSILFAAVLGGLVLGERVGPWRVAGGGLIVGGVALVATA